jgi:hypothetical protein
MGYIGREDDSVSFLHRVCLPRYPHLTLPVNNSDDCIEWCGVLGKSLVFVKGKYCNVSRLARDNHPACNRTLVIIHEIL